MQDSGIRIYSSNLLTLHYFPGTQYPKPQYLCTYAQILNFPITYVATALSQLSGSAYCGLASPFRCAHRDRYEIGIAENEFETVETTRKTQSKSSLNPVCSLCSRISTPLRKRTCRGTHCPDTYTNRHGLDID